jgi:hypothetical protein
MFPKMTIFRYQDVFDGVRVADEINPARAQTEWYNIAEVPSAAGQKTEAIPAKFPETPGQPPSPRPAQSLNHHGIVSLRNPNRRAG